MLQHVSKRGQTVVEHVPSRTPQNVAKPCLNTWSPEGPHEVEHVVECELPPHPTPLHSTLLHPIRGAKRTIAGTVPGSTAQWSRAPRSALGPEKSRWVTMQQTVAKPLLNRGVRGAQPLFVAHPPSGVRGCHVLPRWLCGDLCGARRPSISRGNLAFAIQHPRT